MYYFTFGSVGSALGSSGQPVSAAAKGTVLDHNLILRKQGLTESETKTGVAIAIGDLTQI
jgi:hypothetical protein